MSSSDRDRITPVPVSQPTPADREAINRQAGRVLAFSREIQQQWSNAGPTVEFPVQSFPSWVTDFIDAGNRTLGIPHAYLGASILALAGGLIGNQAELVLKRGWTESPVLWVVLIGEPGAKKSPAIRLASAPLTALQGTLYHQFHDRKAVWNALPQAEQQATDRPVLEHVFTSDATIEALAPMLASSPGMCVSMDEMATWLGSMTRYKPGRSDRSQHLSMWSGHTIKVDRKHADPLMVSRPAVSVLGGLQPDVLPLLRNDSGADDGLIDRLLPVWPQWIAPQWTEEEIDPDIEQTYHRNMLALRSLAGQHQPGDPPLEIRLSPDAKLLWAHWYDNNGIGLQKGLGSKLPSHLARIALILHCLGDAESIREPISEATLNDAIELAEYFRSEHGRMTERLGTSVGSLPTDPGARLKVRVTARLREAAAEGMARTELHRRLGSKTTSFDLDWALDGLSNDGLARLEVQPTTGRPREVWYWIEVDTGMNNMNKGEIRVNNAVEEPEPIDDAAADPTSDESATSEQDGDEPGGWHVL